MSESVNITRVMASPNEPVQLVGSDIRRKRISVRVTKNLRTDPTVGTWWQPTPDMTDLEFMFGSYGDPWVSLKTVPLFDTSHVTGMNSMFAGCSSLTTIPLFNTANVTDMRSMFLNCTSLISIPLLDTSSLVAMGQMFQSCDSLKTIPLLNIENVLSLNTTFYGCTSLISLPALNAIKVNNMVNVFTGCSSLTSILCINISTSFSIAQTALQASAINTLFGNLATIPANSQTVTVTGAPGAATCDRTIATAKGWVVA